MHRVGRTARAGRSGLAISLVKEQDRSLVKAIVKVGNEAKLLFCADFVFFCFFFFLFFFFLIWECAR